MRAKSAVRQVGRRSDAKDNPTPARARKPHWRHFMRRECEATKCENIRTDTSQAHHLRWAGGMITVAEHFDLPALDRLRDLWRDLWWKTPNASFFQSFEAFD